MHQVTITDLTTGIQCGKFEVSGDIFNTFEMIGKMFLYSKAGTVKTGDQAFIQTQSAEFYQNLENFNIQIIRK